MAVVDRSDGRLLGHPAFPHVGPAAVARRNSRAADYAREQSCRAYADDSRNTGRRAFGLRSAAPGDAHPGPEYVLSTGAVGSVQHPQPHRDAVAGAGDRDAWAAAGGGGLGAASDLVALRRGRPSLLA